MSDMNDQPVTAILGDLNARAGGSGRHWKIALQVYNTVLKAVIVAAVATILTVKAGIVDVGDGDDQDERVEVASQVVNGVFTWMAITDQPSYVYRFDMTSRVLKACRERTDSSIHAARYLSKHFPCVFVDTSVVHGNTAEHFEARCSGDDTNVNSLDATKMYVMCGFMWVYDATSRPAILLPALLPPIVLCNIVGQYRLSRLNKRRRNHQIRTVLIAVVVVALVILIMMQANIVSVGDSDGWVEVSSQVINGVFAWMAITNQPLYIYPTCDDNDRAEG
ncbi:hypothetical protein PHYPSEUDO_010066 [Phytophthora pseudosyringae]|uniref:Transmembrane protein n=1 Tax=Phytophthora pseudosyringae TaxID=221518 RepID=A0A8T1VE97_9STRA|nr:hypothetical protein PHYPSEUDO_010066 [Phytophthora pseudosyringae]